VLEGLATLKCYFGAAQSAAEGKGLIDCSAAKGGSCESACEECTPYFKCATGCCSFVGSCCSTVGCCPIGSECCFRLGVEGCCLVIGGP
jgi:hypothetical protein